MDLFHPITGSLGPILWFFWMAATGALPCQPVGNPPIGLPRYPKANKATGMDGIAGRQRQLNLGIRGAKDTKKVEPKIQKSGAKQSRNFLPFFCSRNLPKHKVCWICFSMSLSCHFLKLYWMMQVSGGLFEFGMEESFERIAFHALPYKGQGGMFPRGRGIWKISGILTGILYIEDRLSHSGKINKSLPCKCSSEKFVGSPLLMR